MACKLLTKGVGIPYDEYGTRLEGNGDYQIDPPQEVLAAEFAVHTTCGLGCTYGWCCTREKGHTGLHVARTDPSLDGLCAWWPDGV